MILIYLFYSYKNKTNLHNNRDSCLFYTTHSSHSYILNSPINNLLYIGNSVDSDSDFFYKYLIIVVITFSF